jgi:hypothetical protein
MLHILFNRNRGLFSKTNIDNQIEDQFFKTNIATLHLHR